MEGERVSTHNQVFNEDDCYGYDKAYDNKIRTSVTVSTLNNQHPTSPRFVVYPESNCLVMTLALVDTQLKEHATRRVGNKLRVFRRRSVNGLNHRREGVRQIIGSHNGIDLPPIAIP